MAAGGHFVKKNQNKKVAYRSEMARNALFEFIYLESIYLSKYSISIYLGNYMITGIPKTQMVTYSF